MAKVYQVGNIYYSNTVRARREAGKLANGTKRDVQIIRCTLAPLRYNVLHLAMLNGDRDVWCKREKLYEIVRPGKMRQAPLPCDDGGVFDDPRESDPDFREVDEGSDLVEEGGAGP